MPGSIHVSVLELVGLPSSPQSSSMCSIKVSIGKQAHEMQDKDGASFPLATLRDNLNVSILDAQGNEIAFTDVETRSIAEKGIWDDLFPLKGGGNIRLKLTFNLTQNELNRIRSMRESAARKKQEDLMKRSHSSSELAGSSGGSSQVSVKESNVGPTNNQAKSGVNFVNNGHADQKKEGFTTSKSTGAFNKLPDQWMKERIQGRDMKQQNQLDKKPSNEESPATNKTMARTELSSRTTADIPSKVASVKKTVTINTKPVFTKLETSTPSLPEETEKEIGQLTNKTEMDPPNVTPSLKKPLCNSSKPVSSRFRIAASLLTTEVGNERWGVLSDSSESNETTSVRINTNVDAPINTKPALSRFRTPQSRLISETSGKGKVLSSNTQKVYTSERTTTFSLKTLLEALPRLKKFPSDKFKEYEFSTSDSYLKEKKWRSKRWKSSQDRAISKAFHGIEHHAIDSFRGWIFLNEVIYRCVVSDDRPFEDRVPEDSHSDCSPRLDDHDKATHMVDKSKNEKNSIESNNSESSERHSNKLFTGPTGQVMRIALMVGFALLVIFKDRKK
ncbi:uncharacterized protein LOC130824431 isoform X2 [Amaranthus tricolor]|uniref:uncharacterized protein LOC130824431 isoform X2 n=1 Tax=Amaranthus tricolor TaxID=29722 RepID=UPI00258732BC|nr:uncharacterized protein LOC130824431 isoform X2 [Amaranthus tricolor]